MKIDYYIKTDTYVIKINRCKTFQLGCEAINNNEYLADIHVCNNKE